MCPVGTKQTDIANAVCTSCPSGASNAENASVCTCKRGHNGTADDAACTPCAVGTYKATTGIGECTACPGNATTPDDGSTAETDCACAAGYTGAADACTPCDRDTYKPDLGAHNCTACHANSVTVDTAQRAPSACVCDKFYHRSGDACVLCSDTTIKLDVGDTGCEACPDNTATVDGDRGRCQCKKGYNGTADDAECHECLADTYKDTVGTGECTPCPGEAVTFNVAPPWDAVTKCRCPLGYVGADGTACAAALPGFYKSTYGSSNATACPANRTTAESGAKVESDCFCARGYGNAEGAASNSDCALCAPGTIQPNIANRVCEACPVGTSTRWAELVCVCEPGYAGDANDTACTACPADTYKPARGIGNCTRCPEHAVTIPAGAASASTALTDCTCPPGFFGENGTACTACPVGTFKSEYGNASCTACPANQTTVGPESTALTDCVCNVTFGRVSGVSDALVCHLCPAGEKQTRVGTYECAKCIGGSGTEPGETVCQCLPGHNGTADDAACDACAVGTYKTERGIGNCTACPADRSTHAVGAVLLDECLCGPWLVANASAGDSSCVACPANTFKGGLGDSTGNCTACPAHTVSSAESDAATDCVCQRGYTGADGGACTACSRDTYKDATGSAECTPCPDNSMTLDDASTGVGDCVCKPGYTGNGTACVACAEATFKAKHGPAACDACPAHMHAPAASVMGAACTCMPGYSGQQYAEVTHAEMDDGAAVTLPWGAKTVVTWPEGHPFTLLLDDNATNAGVTTSTDDTTRTTTIYIPLAFTGALQWQCRYYPSHQNMTGEVHRNSSAVACTACAVGEYKASTTNGKCRACSDALATTVGEATAFPQDCLCKPGAYEADGSTCAPCARGTFKSNISNDACTSCAAH